MGELNHLVVEGRREEKNLHRQSHASEELHERHDIGCEGSVANHLVRLVDDHADERAIIEASAHDRLLDGAHAADHHLRGRVVVDALEDASGADVGEGTEFGENVVDLQDQLAGVGEDENLVDRNVLTHVAERSEGKADGFATSVLSLCNEVAAWSTSYGRTTRTGQGCRERLVPG